MKDYVLIQTNNECQEDKLLKQGIYKKHKYFIKQTVLGDKRWFCGYISVNPKTAKQTYPYMSATYKGKIQIDDTVLDDFYIGFDTLEPFETDISLDDFEKEIIDYINEIEK